jgi:hypothetical protein
MPHKDPEARKAYLKAYAAKNREQAYARVKAWREANPEKVAEQHKRYAKKHLEKLAATQSIWKARNPEKARENYRKQAAKKRAEQPEQVKLAKKAYAQRNKAVINAAVARRKAAKLRRTPKWLTKFDKLKIQCIYSIAAMLTRVNNEPWHVDHIIPLQGDLVSGLHVPSNLQAMRGVENVRKHKKFEVTYG